MKIVFKVFLLLSITSLCNISFAQTKRNSAYLELLGNGFAYSVNYDRIIPLTSKISVAPRIGFEYIPRSLKDYPTYGNWSFPLELNVLYSKKSLSKNFFESGVGLSLFNLVEGFKLNANGEISDTKVKAAKITMLRLGFRHQKPEGGIMYRAGILVRLTQDEFSKTKVGDDLFYRIWPGFSLGYIF